MMDMVYQGTVWGPSLWNLFFAPALSVIASASFTDICYADDLNAFKAFANSVTNAEIRRALDEFQIELHTWGAANQVTFNSSKESKHILLRRYLWDPNFKILGLIFDYKLIMTDAVHE